MVLASNTKTLVLNRETPVEDKYFKYVFQRSEVTLRPKEYTGQKTLMMDVDGDGYYDDVFVDGLIQQEATSTGVVLQVGKGDTVAFFKGDRNGKLSESPEVLFYEMEIDGNPELGLIRLLQAGDFNRDGKDDFRFVFIPNKKIGLDQGTAWKASIFIAYGK